MTTTDTWGRPTHRSSAPADGRPWSRRLLRAGALLAVPLTLVGIWLGLTSTETVDEIFLPAPATIWDRAFTLRGELLDALAISLQQVWWGVLIGMTAGISIGLFFGISSLARDLFEFTLDAIRPVPVFALIPLFVLWFGVGRAPQIALVAFGVFLILSFVTIEAVRNVPQIYVRAALTCGASRTDVYLTVVLPAIVPELIVGIRYGAIAAWGLDVAAEFSGSQEGLGYFMIARSQYLDSAGITLAVLIYCGLAIAVDRILRALGRRMQRWNPRVVGGDYVQDMLGGVG